MMMMIMAMVKRNWTVEETNKSSEADEQKKKNHFHWQSRRNDCNDYAISFFKRKKKNRENYRRNVHSFKRKCLKIGAFYTRHHFMVIILIPPQQTAFDGSFFSLFFLSFCSFSSVATLTTTCMNSDSHLTMTITILCQFFFHKFLFRFVLKKKSRIFLDLKSSQKVCYHKNRYSPSAIKKVTLCSVTYFCSVMSEVFQF